MTSPNEQPGPANPLNDNDADDPGSTLQTSTTPAGNSAPILSYGIQYIEQTGSANPLNGVDVNGTSPDGYSAPSFADLNGDGNLDLIVGAFDGTLRYYQNTGNPATPVFTLVTGSDNPLNGFDVDFHSTPSFADLNGDGNLDLIVGAFNGRLRYYQNVGTSTAPAFAELTGSDNPLALVGGDFYSTPSFADLDGDGDLDAIVGAFNGTLRYYQNIGTSTTPAFTQLIGVSNPFNGLDAGDYSTPSFADLNSDGRPDAIVGTNDGTLKYFLNTGTTTAPAFTEVTGSANLFNSITGSSNSTPSFADLNNDGGLDLVIGQWDGALKYYQFVPITTASALTYQEQAAAALIDPNLTVTDINASDFNGGSLTVSINSILSSDRLTISPSADFSLGGASRSELSYQGRVIGSVSGGVGSSLVIAFSNRVTADVITALLRRISYASTANDPPASRIVSVVLAEANGISSAPLSKTINITGINDAPTFTRGSNITVDEDAPPQSIVWATNISAIEAGQTRIFQVTTDNDALFAVKPAIDSVTGRLTYTLAPNVSGIANVTVLLKDNGGTTNGGVDFSQQTFTITVNPVNDAPTAVVFANTTSTIAEDIDTTTRLKVADINITDDALGTNILSLSGTDAALFEIDGNALYLKAGTQLNFETRNRYSVTVDVDDATVGNTPDASQPFTLTVSDVNDPPTGLRLSNTTLSIAENTDTTRRIKVANIRVRDDVLGTNYLSLRGANASCFEIDGNALYLKAKTVLDYEAQSSYSVIVAVDDPTVGNAIDRFRSFTLIVTDVNEAASALTLSNTTLSIAENSDTTTRIQVADISVTDDALGTNTLFLSGVDAALFELDGNALYLKANTTLNFEARRSYRVTVSVDDPTVGDRPDASQAFVLRVRNLKETPAPHSPIADLTDQISKQSTAALSSCQGNDILLGRVSQDQMTGGNEKDWFVRAKAGEGDRIADFKVEEGDRIVVSSLYCSSALTARSLTAEQLRQESQTIAADRSLYSHTTGILAFDVQGNGSTRAIGLAQLAGSSNLISESMAIV